MAWWAFAEQLGHRQRTAAWRLRGLLAGQLFLPVDAGNGLLAQGAEAAAHHATVERSTSFRESTVTVMVRSVLSLSSAARSYMGAITVSAAQSRRKFTRWKALPKDRAPSARIRSWSKARRDAPAPTSHARAPT